MHGRLKVRSSEEQEKARKKERDDKARQYTAVMARIFKKRASGGIDDESLQLTRDVLSVNPEIATLWNYRREILLDRQANMCTEEFAQLCCKELSLLENCLRVNPKAYCVWQSREWVLLHSPQADWATEKGLCDKFLNYDERNFHCWDHRRFVISQSKCVSASDEFSFTYDKIASNFSNYSAWHYRSKLLPLVHPSTNGRVSEAALTKEHELAQNAFFTDPDDQSAWFYHRWLLGEVTSNESVDLAYLQLGQQPKLYIAFNQAVKVGQRLCLTLDGERATLAEGDWPNTLYQTNLTHLPDSLNISFAQQNISLSRENVYWVRGDGLLPWTRTQATPSLLASQLDSCEQLLQEEPSNKWCLLTTVLLMQALDPLKYSSQIRRMSLCLCQVDPLRQTYYTDLLSGIMLRGALRDSLATSQTALDLSAMGLTRLEHTQYLVPYTRLDLSGNALMLLPRDLVCPMLTALLLDGNHLECLPRISAPLQHLSIANNNIAELESIGGCLRELPALTVLCLQGNPLCLQGNPLLETALRAMLPGLRELTL